MSQGLRSMPILPASSVKDTVAFFTDGLGFELAGVWSNDSQPASFAIVQLDQITVGIAKSEKPASSQGWAAYFYVADISAFADHILGNGVPLLRGPEDSFYHCLELEIEDPNGNRLCFAQDLKPGSNGPGL